MGGKGNVSVCIRHELTNALLLRALQTKGGDKLVLCLLLITPHLFCLGA